MRDLLASEIDKFMAANTGSTWRRVLRAITILLIPILTAVACGFGPLAAFAMLIGGPGQALPAKQYPWVSWGSPPVKAVRILGTYQKNLCVEAKDRTRYVKQDCSAPSPECWRKIELWRRVVPPEDTPKNVQFRAPAPPGKVVDSVEIQSIPFQTNYAVLEDGSVWVWDYQLPYHDDPGVGAIGVGLLFCGGAAGLVIGLSISFVLAVRTWGWGRAILYFAIVAAIYAVVKGVEFVINEVVGH